MWNWIAAILTFAMLVVLGTIARIIWVEYRRQTVRLITPNIELLVFAVTGASVVVVLWSILAVQWLKL